MYYSIELTAFQLEVTQNSPASFATQDFFLKKLKAKKGTLEKSCIMENIANLQMQRNAQREQMG